MFTNVLVGVDGRSSGRDAVALARRLAAPGTKLTLAHVRAGFTHPLQAATPVLLAEEAEESERLLREELSAPGWTPQLLAMSGVTDCYQPVERRLRACTPRPSSRARICWWWARAAAACWAAR